MLPHRTLQRFLAIAVNGWAEIVGFPIHQIKPLAVLENQIHIALHETGDRTEN